MQGVAVVCGILWDVFVRFVWYSCGVGAFTQQLAPSLYWGISTLFVTQE